MRVLKLLAVSLLVFGCTDSTVNIKTESKIEITEKPQRKSCSMIERDLSISWKQRKYWCAPDGYEQKSVTKPMPAKAQINKNKSHNEKPEIQKNVSVTPNQQVINIVDVLRTLSKKDLEAVLSKLVIAYKTQAALDQNMRNTQNNLKPLSDIQINDAELVWFAPNIEVLGPKGRNKIQLLLKGDIDAQQIVLRGYASEELDTDRQDLDQLAVARALSVRKMLQEKGIDESKIKILYRNKKENGRYVEVMING